MSFRENKIFKIISRLCALLLISAPTSVVGQEYNYKAENQEMQAIISSFSGIRNSGKEASIQFLDEWLQQANIPEVNRLRVAILKYDLLLSCEGNESAIAFNDQIVKQYQTRPDLGPLESALVEFLIVEKLYLSDLKTDYQKTSEAFNRHLEVFKTLGLASEVINAYENLAYDRIMSNNLGRASDIYQEARAYALEQGEAGLVETVDILIGSGIPFDGDLHYEFADRLVTASEYFREVGDQISLLKTNMAMLYHASIFEGDEKLKVVKENENLAKQLGARSTLASLVQFKAITLARMERYDDAIRATKEGVFLSEYLGSEELGLWMKADMLRLMVKSEDSKYATEIDDLLTPLLKWAIDIEDDYFIARIAADFAQFSIRNINFEQAQSMADLALEKARIIDFKPLTVDVLLVCSKVSAMMSDYDQAYAYLNECYELKMDQHKDQLKREQSNMSLRLQRAIRMNEFELKEALNELNEIKIKQQDFEIQEQQLEMEEIKMRQLSISLLAIVLLVIIFSIYFVYRRKLKSEQRLLELTETLETEQTRLLLEKAKNEENQIDLRTSISRLKAVDEQRKEILGIAAHDMKNPVASVESLLGIIKQDIKQKEYERLESYIDLCTDSTKYLRELVEQILKARRIDEISDQFELRWIKPESVLEPVIAMNTAAAKQKDMQFRYKFDHCCEVYADSQGLREVLDNLISNAVKYSFLGSEIVVSLKCSEDTLSISIQDSGPGFLEDDFKNMFKPFTKLSALPTGGENSSGLGLASVKSTLEAMKGSISIENASDGGAIALVKLPGRMRKSERLF